MGNKNIKDYGFGSKNRTKEFDDAARAKARGVPRKRIWTKDKCIDELEDCLTMFKKILKDDAKININNPTKLKAESVRDLNNIMNRVIQFMDRLYPVVQKSINLNIDTTSGAVIERLQNWKKAKVIDVEDLEVQVVPEGEVLEEQPVEVVDDI